MTSFALKEGMKNERAKGMKWWAIYSDQTRRVVTAKGSLVRESGPQNGRTIQVKDLE